MTRLELTLINLAEVASTELHRERDFKGFNELQRDAKEQAGSVGMRVAMSRQPSACQWSAARAVGH
jgi:hypothetical protein